MDARNLTDRLKRMPMLAALVPFAAGIAAAMYCELPQAFVAGGAIVCGASALLLRSQVYAAAMLFLFGFAASQLSGSEPDVPRDVRTDLELLVLTPPAAREGYTSSTAQVRAWRDPATGRWRAARGKVIVWADTTQRPAAGERIVCSGRIRPFSSRHEGYRRLMLRRGYAGTLRLSARQVLAAKPERSGSLHLLAVERLGRLRLDPAARALCNAMTAGDRSALTPELRATYARSGTSHLLAVSGLHVGIVFVLVNLLLWGLPALWPRKGHIVRNLAAVALIWLYAAVADFSPSVVRAAAMCSVLQFALASASAAVGMNTLAATGFGMLLLHPAYLGDIGFQLSFLSVAAILAWGVPLCRMLRTGRRWVDLPAAGLVVGAVTALATAPLVSHTFGIVSLAGLLVNPAAILLAHVIVFAGVVWIALPVGALAPAFEAVMGGAARLLDALCTAAAGLPWAAFEVRIGAGATAACYALFLAATLLAACRNPKKAVSLRR